MKMKTCLICTSKGKLLFNVGDKEIYFCKDCDFGWTKNFSMPKYSDYHFDDSYNLSRDLFENTFTRLWRKTFKYKKKGRMLEIGSSVGNLLQVFKSKGWQVEGIEPSKKAVEIANKNNLPSKVATIESAKLSPSHYDLVVLSQTLEHLEDPKLALKKIKGILKKDGLILIGVPNFSSISRKVFKSRWPFIIPDEHLWHFSPKSISRLLESCGFEVLEISAVSGIFDFDDPILELWNSLKGLKKRFIISIVTLPFSIIMTSLNNGSGLVIVAKKR